jgi:glycosyl transferase family 25
MDIGKFVINLADRTDRRQEMNHQLLHVGWSAQFSNSDRPTSLDGFPSLGARGCFQSHLEILKRGHAMGGHIVIMEDDLNFVADFAHLWNSAYEALQMTDWNIFYAAHLLHGRSELTLLDPSEEVLCAHFLMFNEKAAVRIIEGLEAILSRPSGHPLGGPMHVDGAYSTIRKQNPEMKTFAFFPSLGYQRPSRSDIADLKFYDRIKPLRPLIGGLRRAKNSLMRNRR